MAELPYRPCVGVMVINRAGLVFVGRRRADAGTEHGESGFAWQMPQGGIDPGEQPFAAALRELYEETNIRSVALLGEVPDWLSYDLPVDICKTAWRGRYKGQTQKWFALRFEGHEAEIDIHRPGAGAHKPEFDDWRWESLANLPDLIIPFKRPIYEKVCAAFRPFTAI